MAESILITVMPDGKFHVKSMEDDASAADQPVDQTVASVDEVIQLVQQELGDEQAEPGEGTPAEEKTDTGEGPSEDQMWNQEAAKRQPSGLM